MELIDYKTKFNELNNSITEDIISKLTFLEQNGLEFKKISFNSLHYEIGDNKAINIRFNRSTTKGDMTTVDRVGVFTTTNSYFIREFCVYKRKFYFSSLDKIDFKDKLKLFEELNKRYLKDVTN